MATMTNFTQMMPAVEKPAKETSCRKMRNDGSDRETIPGPEPQIVLLPCSVLLSAIFQQSEEGSVSNVCLRPIGQGPPLVLAVLNYKSGIFAIVQPTRHENAFRETPPAAKYRLQRDSGSNINVLRESVIAVLGTQRKNFSEKVISFNNNSVVTRGCRDLQIKCIAPNGIFRGESSVIDICYDYKITEKLKNPDPSYPPTPQNPTIGVTVGVLLGVLVLCGIIGMLCWYISWKKKQHDGATVSEFLRYLWSCLRNGIPQAETGEAPTNGDPEGRGVQEVGSGALDTTQHNSGIKLSVISASDRKGENVIEQDDTLESVYSNDPEADGETPPSFSLNRIFRNGGIQPTANGDISAPDVSRASIHQAVNGSLRDDPGGYPGGVNDSKGKGNKRIREMPNGRTRGDRGPEDDENDEGQPLMSDQRPANQGFDMTGGAVALVDKRGFEPDPVSRCSTAPDTDVESTSNMKN